MKEFVVYTVARLGLFAATFGIVLGIWFLAGGGNGASALLPFVLAVVISAVASYYLLRGPRERFAQVVNRRAEAASRKFEEIRSKEDTD